MDQGVQSRVEELEQNVQAKDRELAQSQQELRQNVYRFEGGYTFFNRFVCFDCRRNSCIPVRDNPSSRLG